VPIASFHFYLAHICCCFAAEIYDNQLR
jgi:hypothetical protein